MSIRDHCLSHVMNMCRLLETVCVRRTLSNCMCQKDTFQLYVSERHFPTVCVRRTRSKGWMGCGSRCHNVYLRHLRACVLLRLSSYTVVLISPHPPTLHTIPHVFCIVGHTFQFESIHLACPCDSLLAFVAIQPCTKRTIQQQSISN